MPSVVERGAIRHRELAQRLRDFTRMRWGNITPTDIDGFFEIGNKIFVFFEVKFGTVEMPYGQELALERLVDAVGKTKHALLVIANYECKADEDIPFHNCIVTKYRSHEKWHIPSTEIKLKVLIDKYLESVHLFRK